MSMLLMKNLSFEKATINYTDWTLWCTHTCDPDYEGSIITGSNCSTGNCYKSHCNNGGTDYLVQQFPAIINRIFYFEKDMFR